MSERKPIVRLTTEQKEQMFKEIDAARKANKGQWWQYGNEHVQIKAYDRWVQICNQMCVSEHDAYRCRSSGPMDCKVSEFHEYIHKVLDSIGAKL